MDLFTVIRTRQSTNDLLPDPVGRQVIEQLLEAAVQAPNHYRVRPWRFVVLTGAGRERMGEVLARSFAARFPDAPAAALEKERQKPLRAPLLIAVAVDPPSEGKIPAVENLCAAAAACENLLLAAHALGLGTKWRTGEDARNPELKEFLGFGPDRELIGLLYIGYPAQELVAPERPGFQDRTVWME